MQISFEGKIGILVGLIALVLAGAPLLGSEYAGIGWASIGLGAVGLYALAAFQIKQNKRDTSVLVLIGTGLMLAGAIVGFIGALRMDGPRQTDASEVSILLDFNYDVLPRVAPANGTIKIFEIRQVGERIEAMPIDYQFAPSEVINWQRILPDWPVFGVSRCEITTSESMPVIDASFTIDIAFKEMVPHNPNQEIAIGEMIEARTGGQQMRSGKVVLNQQAQIAIKRVYRDAPQTIYFMNRSKYLAILKLSETGTAHQIGKSWTDSDREQRLRLKFSRPEPLYLSARS